MGAFVIGGLVGAAAVLYMTRGKNSMMLSSVTGDMFGKAMGKAKNKFSGMNRSESNVMNSSGKQNDNKLDGLSDVENIVKQDNELNNQVQQILSENNQSGYATQ
jgi:gas vesicle protein